jgi:hypothetical protein
MNVNSILALALAMATLCPGTVILLARYWPAKGSDIVVGQVVPLPTGSTREGQRIARSDLASARCHFIRYVAKTCFFSRSSRRAFDRLEQRAIALGCRNTVVAPELDAFDDGAGCRAAHVHLAFPDMEFATKLELSATPTFVVLDASGRVLWRKVGVASERDMFDGERAMSEATSGPPS